VIQISDLSPQGGIVRPQLFNHRRLLHNQDGKLDIRRTPIPSQHNLIIS